MTEMILKPFTVQWRIPRQYRQYMARFTHYEPIDVTLDPASLFIVASWSYLRSTGLVYVT